MNAFIKNWWNDLKYEQDDPRRLAGGNIKIAVIGGGTGLSNLLRGLKRYSDQITAIVSVTDDGKSSGLIKNEFDILPPGDIRKCISALAKNEELISGVLEYRFNKKDSLLSGHTLGNIWIAVLSKYFGSFSKAIEATTEIFATSGKVMPATLSKTELCAIYEDGKIKEGESQISRPGKRINKVFMKNASVGAYSKAAIAIAEADLVVFGPGSLYTSVIPNLLIYGIKKAIKDNTKSLNIFVCNCSTERGETENYSVEDHIQAVIDHLGGNPFDFCLVNKKVIKTSKSASKLGNINNITTRETEILGCKIIQGDVVNNKNPLYHDSEKLAKTLIELYNKNNLK